MIKFQKLKHLVICLTILVSWGSFAEPLNLGHLINEIKTYHDSGGYDKEIKTAVSQAQAYIAKRAKENRALKNPKKLAIVLDIDETSLSNYDKMVARQFGATHRQLRQENLQANARVIRPTLKLYQAAIKNHVAVFFVTGRRTPEKEATIKNLKRIGYHHWQGLYFKPEAYNETSTIPFKSQARADIEKNGYVIIASIGDQYSDLLGGHAEKTYKLPNPFYYLP